MDSVRLHCRGPQICHAASGEVQVCIIHTYSLKTMVLSFIVMIIIHAYSLFVILCSFIEEHVDEKRLQDGIDVVSTELFTEIHDTKL